MEIENLLKGVTCSCGRRHTCDIERVIIGSDVLSRLEDLCEKYTGILLVADENTFAAAGSGALEALKGKDVRRMIFPGTPLLIPNEESIGQIRNQLEGRDLILGIGSGVIQDLCKYVSHFSGIPYMIAATAPSMDGYASTGAAMILKGMKETVPCGLPRVILGDLEVLKQAPMDMIRAGFGDILGKYSALCDWELSRLVNGEYFCREIYDTTYRMIENTLALADGLQNRDSESIRALTEALVVVGIMMSFAGSSRPASGSEHHLSHFFEITGIVRGEPYFPHGVDVAFSTAVTCGLREKLAAQPFPHRRFRLSPEHYRQKMEAIYGPCAPGCMALQEKVGNYAADRTERYLEQEQAIRALFSRYPGKAEILSILDRAGLQIGDFTALYGTGKIAQAISYAKDLKDRYSVLWLYYDLFGDTVEI